MVKTHMGARQTHRAPPDPPSERSGWHELQQVEPHHTLPDDLGGRGGAQWLVACGDHHTNTSIYELYLGGLHDHTDLNGSG